jgi:hypothetical protein
VLDKQLFFLTTKAELYSQLKTQKRSKIAKARIIKSHHPLPYCKNQLAIRIPIAQAGKDIMPDISSDLTEIHYEM